MNCTAALACAVVVLATIGTTPAYTAQQRQEMLIGQKEYRLIAAQGEILPVSPFNAILDPIARRIAAVADPQYFRPFHFTLIFDSSPNAFAVPGGNVYVTTAMMKFVQNREELAGVLCHETSHDIHHDVVNLNPRYATIDELDHLLDRLFKNDQTAQSLVGVAANADEDQFSRRIETNADHLGAYTCAKAGFNPWGMVWLMKRFQKSDTHNAMEFLSDHPRDDHRISDLEAEFRNDPATFARFSPNIASAHPL